MSLSKRDSEVIWHPYTQMQNADAAIPIVRGEGVYLFDENNNKYIDAISSWWVNIHGHAHPYIADKIHQQLKTLEHVIFAGFTHQPAIELAERLLQILPGNLSKVFYSDNGSTAVEVALKMALQYWHNKGKTKNKIIVFESAYHGDTFGAMSVSARGAFNEAFSKLLFDVISIPLPVSGKESACVEALENCYKQQGDEIAAFIFEPLVLGAGGMLMYRPEVLDELIGFCKNNQIICIADEVMTGFGRTGKNFACNYLNEEPDIVCLSKGITGGTMAFGVTACKEFIYEAFLSDDKLKAFFHGHSYTANPVACAASLASLDILLSVETQNAIDRISVEHKLFVEEIKSHLALSSARSIGTIVAFDIKHQEGTHYFSSLRDELYNFFLQKGIILRPLGNTIYIMPPYVISNEDLKIIYAAIREKLDGFCS